MSPRTKLYLGPLLTFVTVSVLWLFERYVFALPNPGAIFYLPVVFAAYIGGLEAGLISVAIALTYAMVHFSPPGQLFNFHNEGFQRVLTLAIFMPVVAVMAGLLKSRAEAALRREREARLMVEMANRRLITLQAALDESSQGIVLLDHELRAQFINRAFRNMWNLPDEVADRRPPFVALMYHGRDTRAYAVPDERLDAYVADRVRRIRAGDLDPLDIRLSNGTIYRLECDVLPAGGRMLSYTPVTDLVQRASVDSMTSLFNRRHFLELAEGEWSRFDRYERPLSLMMLDIDLFKSINDRYGHDVGDRVIVHIADICRDSKRASDIVARIGGEEFVMLLPETPLESAQLVAERLRTRIAETPLDIAGAPIGITASIGVAAASPAMENIAALMKATDEALYRAKNAGRNRVVCNPDIAPHKPPLAIAS